MVLYASGRIVFSSTRFEDLPLFSRYRCRSCNGTIHAYERNVLGTERVFPVAKDKEEQIGEAQKGVGLEISGSSI